MADMVKRFCNTFLVEGVFLMLIGALLVLLPQVSSIALSLLVSVGLILGGVYKFISSIIRRDEIEKAWLSVAIALLMVLTGTYLTMAPILSLFVLTMAVGLYLLLEGVNSMVMAFESKGMFKYWWAGIGTGLVQFALAFIILFGLPGSALFTLGFLVGINMVLSGIAVLAVYAGAGCPRLTQA